MTDLRPRVSIITPTWNHGNFIAACLESVLRQSFRSWEMVVIDDASRDDTAAIAGEYARRDSRITLIRHAANRGMNKLAGTYNEGLDRGSAEWVAILEGDDAWPPDKLERQLRELDSDPEIILGFGKSKLLSPAGCVLRDAQSGLPRRYRRYFENYRGDFLIPLLSRPCFIPPVTVMIRRRALESIGGFQQPDGLDLVDHPSFLELTRLGPFFGSASILGYYRRHNSSQSLNRIVDLTAAERRLHENFLARHAPTLPAGLRRDLDRSWAAETIVSLLTEGRLLLIRGRRGPARASFLKGLLRERRDFWSHPPLLFARIACLAALILSYLPLNPERIFGLLKLRRRTLLERSIENRP
jgi:glycosyltransferase involved in cell wall biosynthesis